MNNKNINELEDLIGYKFKDIELLYTAITHSSYSFEHKISVSQNYERTEFFNYSDGSNAAISEW